MTCIQDSPEVQYPKPQPPNSEKSPSEQATAVMLRLVKKGSLTTCLTTNSAGALGNSGIKSAKELSECSENG